MANSIQVDLIANDLMSPVIQQIQARAGIFAPLVGAAISAAFSPDPVVGFAKVAAGAIETVLAGVGKLNDALQDAASFQTDAIGNANSLSTVTGLGFSVAQEAMQKMNVQLANIAKDLPGKAQDFISAANQIAPAFADGFGKVTEKDLPRFQDRLVGLTKNLVLLGQQAKVTSESTADWSRGFISGTRGWGELRQLDFGQKNPAFLKAIEAELKRQGKTTESIQKMTAAQRLAVLETVSSKGISGDAIRALQNSADGIAASMSDHWFSPLVGIFGVMRKIQSVGDRTVLDAYTGLLRTVQDFSDTMEGIAKKLGLTFDPMKIVVDTIDWLNDTLLAFTNSFKGLSSGELMKAFSFQGVLDGIWDGYHKFWKAVPWHKIGVWVGDLLGQGIVTLCKALLNPENWLNAARNVLDFGVAILALLWGFIKGLVQQLCDGLNDAMNWLVDGIKNFVKGFIPGSGVANPIVETGRAIVSGTQALVGGTVDATKQILGIPNAPPVTTPVAPLATPQQDSPTNSQKVSAQPNINVSVQATTNANPHEIAKHVSQRIAEDYRNYQLSNAIA